MGDSASSNLILQKEQLVNNRDQVGDLIRRRLENIDSYQNQPFSSMVRRQIDRVGPGYLDVVKSLDAEAASQGTAWLQEIVDALTGQMLAFFPAIR
jgi:hypothetical protein